MRNFLLPAALLTALAGVVAPQLADADVFTWVDSSGRVNVSNLDPPAGARVTSVVRVKAPRVVAPVEPARDALRQAEVAALTERVRQLQDEVEAARRPAPPRTEYRVLTAPPAAPDVTAGFAPTALPYSYAAPPQPDSSCVPGWAGCALSWYPGFVTSIIVVRPQRFHRFRAQFRHRDMPRLPIRPAGGRHRMR